MTTESRPGQRYFEILSKMDVDVTDGDIETFTSTRLTPFGEKIFTSIPREDQEIIVKLDNLSDEEQAELSRIGGPDFHDLNNKMTTIQNITLPR